LLFFYNNSLKVLKYFNTLTIKNKCVKKISFHFIIVIRSYIGYCPQFDALNDRLTPREHLEFYSRVRNLPSVLLNTIVNESLNK
jgi:ABC-type multidrug transport system, ATPase component